MKTENMHPSHETLAGSSPNHLLGNRKLMAMGAMLGWLLMVHLLVNVWLLCLLSVLLVALGGWVGSQAMMGVTGRLHLERFITLPSCPPSPEAESQLDQEINHTIQKIIRDFVSSWYCTVSSEPAFEEEVRAAMMGMAQELRRRMGMVNRQALTQRVLTLCGCHLQSYMKAKEVTGRVGAHAEPSQLWEAYCQATASHPAVQSPCTEVNYARGIVDLMLQGLAPKPHLETRTGRYVVVELITCNVLLPLISKMSDPDWIHLVLVGIFSKTKAGTTEEAESVCPAKQLDQPPVPRSLPLTIPVEKLPEVRIPSPAGAMTLPNYSGSEGIGSHSPEVEEGQEALEGDLNVDSEGKKSGNNASHFLQPDSRGPLFLCEDSELDSPLSDLGKDTDSIMLMTPSDFLTDRLQDALTALEGGSEALESEEGEGPEGTETEEGPEADTSLLTSMLKPCPEIQINSVEKDEEQDDLMSLTTFLEGQERTCLPRPSCLEKDLTDGVSPLDPSLPQVLLSSSPTGPLSSATFSFEPLSSPDGPVVIQNLRITGTITAREHSGTSFHPYTLYTVKYETALDSENSSGLQQVAYHTVNRRYREFLNLQTRLEEKPDLRKFIKNVKGPKKLFPDLPFGNMDSDRVEARKSLLESFLKMVVSAIVDTLKTAFPRSEPQSPTEELSEAETDGKPQTEGKKANKSRLRFPSSKIAPVLNVAESHEKVLYCLRESNVESDILSISGMESFIEKQSRFLEIQAEDTLEKDSEQNPKQCTDGCSGKPSDNVPSLPDESNSDQEAETGLADTALDLLLLLMMEQWRWLCTENMQKALRLLFGTLIQRWLEVQVANLTCPQRWVQYLRLLQESIWPGGTLPVLPKPLRTQKQKEATEEQALQSLMGVLPDLVVEILGASKCRLSWGLVLESLQQPLINRHLIYCLWDIILEFLDLSASAEESATTTPAPDTPGNSRRMGVSP
ncbi:sorting nexin-19 isoform X3 [Gracilinanus agilis]|uniref:sorting nexin-19 isoform X3 n=1 Tax=Gracilinanus agilis TaxID=191870 RepID=UPI001CFC5C7F|nr:sorting nexin-19 isoform X3 [Gracilinanus agilis]